VKEKEKLVDWHSFNSQPDKKKRRAEYSGRNYSIKTQDEGKGKRKKAIGQD